MNDQKSERRHHEKHERPNLYEGVRGTAVKILNRVERTDAYLEKLLDNELRLGELNDLDKGLLTEIVHGVLRWQNKLDWILNGFSHGNFAKSEINLKNALRVALYQILMLDRIPHSAAVNEGVEFVKRIRGDKPAGLVNAVLRNIIRNIDGIRYPDPAQDEVQYLAVVLSHPHFIVKRWHARFGFEETKKFLTINNEKPDISLRINRLKGDPALFLKHLDEQMIPYEGSSHIGYFVKAKTLPKIAHMDLFKNGMFTVQDESAALPTLLLAPQPGETIIDMCSAPGGKATHIAETMNNQGTVIAFDKYDAKLGLIRSACDRLGISIIETKVGDGLTVEHEAVDKVLVDAPCSGLGVIMKKPDLKWKRDISDIMKLAQLQRGLLENGAKLVKPGGVLVYSTCTTEPEENQEILNSFLADHPEFVVDDAKKYVSSDLVTREGYVETFPHRHGMDGSFCVRLLKSDAATT